MNKLLKVYETVKMGDPMDSQVLLGPLHSRNSVKLYEEGLVEIKKQVRII